MDLTSTLKLSIEKGPREGETLEYNSKPRLTIKIGRAARGNTIAIKEDGISSKHLSIECCSHDKWVVKDLDSSNGTYLNSNSLPPLTDYDLRDGDVLKIGELTSIRVQISNVSESQIGGRSLRSEARVLVTENENDVQKFVEGGNRRGKGRGRGRGRGRGYVNVGDEGSGMDGLDSIVTVNSEAEVQRGRGRGRGKGLGRGGVNVGAEGIGMDGPDSIATVNSEVEVQRGRGKGKARGKNDRDLEDEGSKSANVDLQPVVNPETSENVESIKQNEVTVSTRRTRSSKNEEDNVEVDVECKVEPAVGSRRITRSRGLKNKDNLVSTSTLEKIPEASQLENVRPSRKRRGRKEIDAKKGIEEELNVVEEGRQENCNEAEVFVIKPEPHSNVEGILSKGEHPSKESVHEIVQKDAVLACQLNFEHEIEKELEASLNPECFQESTAAEKDAEELEATSNQDNNSEPECNVGRRIVCQESTAAEKDGEAKITLDLSKMTLGEWFDYLERALPKQILAETDKIIEDMLKKSQQVHEFLLHEKQDEGKQPLS